MYFSSFFMLMNYYHLLHLPTIIVSGINYTKDFICMHSNTYIYLHTYTYTYTYVFIHTYM